MDLIFQVAESNINISLVFENVITGKPNTKLKFILDFIFSLRTKFF